MVNKVILIGNLGNDPEIRYTQKGTQVVNFRIATTERWRGQDGQMQEQTEWHNIVAWDRLAEICGQYLHKGSRVYIEGKLQTRKWQDQSGQDRYTTEIVAREMKMLSPRDSEGGGYGGGGGNYGGSGRGGSYGGRGGGNADGGFQEPPPYGNPGGPATGDDVPF